MRQKVGTALDEDLLKRAKVRAVREGIAFNDLLEAALQAYLSRHVGSSAPRLVKDSWGVFRVTHRELRRTLREDILET